MYSSSKSTSHQNNSLPPSPSQSIHDKIISLDLQQVHAKIKQVDSHATLGNGIVIQVRLRAQITVYLTLNPEEVGQHHVIRYMSLFCTYFMYGETAIELSLMKNFQSEVACFLCSGI